MLFCHIGAGELKGIALTYLVKIFGNTLTSSLLLPQPFYQIRSSQIFCAFSSLRYWSQVMRFLSHHTQSQSTFQRCSNIAHQNVHKNAVRFHSDHNAYITREDTVYEWWLTEIVNKFRSVIQKPSKFDPTFLLLEQLKLISRNAQYLHLHAQTTEVG